MKIAVLTGDIVGSEELSDADLDAVLSEIASVGQDGTINGGGDGRTARWRGDEWQLVLQKPEFALRVALAIRAALIAQDIADTRVAIGLGMAREPLRDDAARGPAFTRSGRALDAMGDQQRLVHADGGPIGAATALADAMSQTWTAAQARALKHLLRIETPTRAEVGKALGITRQAVDKAAHAAYWPAIQTALEQIEHAR